MSLPTLNVGCGYYAPKMPGVICCDYFPTPVADVRFNAEAAWPFKSNSVGCVKSTHVLEHLRNFENYFAEAFRVLAPGGILSLSLPHATTDAAIGDCTHVSHWIPQKFCFLQPGYDEAIGNPQHQKRPYAFEIEYVLVRVNPRLRWMCRWWSWWLGRKIIDFIWNGYCELHVQLRALKNKEQLDNYKSLPNFVPMSRILYKHEVQKRMLRGGERPEIFHLDTIYPGYSRQTSI